MKIQIDSSTKRVYFYIATSILSVAFAFISNWLMTRLVDPNVYGLYKYASNFLLTIPAIFEVGIHFSCSRIVAARNSDEKDGVVFASSVLTFLIGGVLTIAFTIVSLMNGYFSLDLKSLVDISVIFPFLAIFTFRILVLQVYQGTAKTNQLAILTLLQYIIQIIGILLGRYIFDVLSFEYIIVVFCVSWIIVLLPFTFRMQFSLKKIKQNMLEIFQETKKSGFFVYLGTVVTTLSTTVIGLISGSIYGYAEYGYYSLALSFAQAFTIISSAMASVKFKENVNQKTIPPKDIRFMIILNTFTYIVFLFMIGPLFSFFFTADYSATVFYLIFLGIAYSINGIILYFNRFFVARGCGKITTQNSLFASIVNIVSAAVLVPAFQIKGLVFSGVVSSVLSLCQYIISYRKYLRSVNSAEVLAQDRKE